MSFAPQILEQHIYTLLNADSDLTDLVSGIYNRTPQHSAFPYVTVPAEQFTFSDRGNESKEGHAVEFQVSTWSRNPSKLGVFGIMKEIDRILHRSDEGNGAIEGWRVLDFHRTLQTTKLDPDNETWQGIQRFRVLLAECDTVTV